ncbi:hypothetical protein HC766_00640 [Candidatus Gracilibacteria bacterium]|nr:hypothetical protein [Candidatus Gracilibacteria bacterium]NJS40895.1 hypothetical protein [Candidatus Gracilibacteria bacterium]
MNTPKHQRFRDLFALAKKSLEEGDFNNALQAANKALDISPNNPQIAKIIEQIKQQSPNCL